MKNAMLKLFAAAIGLSVGISAPAFADPAIGTRIDRGGKGLSQRHHQLTGTAPRVGLYEYYQCMAGLNRPVALKTLDMTFDGEEQRAQMAKLFRPVQWPIDEQEDCHTMLGGVKMRFHNVGVVGGFAEWAIDTYYDADDVARIASLTADDWKTTGLTPRNGSEAFGMCVTQAHGTLVYDLVNSGLETAEESQAIQALVPHLGPCVRDGQEVSFDKTSLRSMLAFGLYRTLSGAAALRGEG